MCWRATGTAVTPLEPRSDSRLWGCVRTPWLNRISVFEHLFRQPVPSDTHSASRKKDVVCRGYEDCSWSAISTGSYGVSMTKNRTNERVNGPFPKRERDGLSARCLDLKSGNTCEHPRYIGVSRHFQISLPLIDTRIVMLPFEAAHRRILGLILPDFGVLPETVGGVLSVVLPVFCRFRSIIRRTPDEDTLFSGISMSVRCRSCAFQTLLAKNRRYEGVSACAEGIRINESVTTI
jgi:hypothetical protein